MRDSLRAEIRLKWPGMSSAPDLAAAIDSLKAAELFVTRSPIHWFEIVAESGRSMTPAGSEGCTRMEEEWSSSAFASCALLTVLGDPGNFGMP